VTQSTYASLKIQALASMEQQCKAAGLDQCIWHLLYWLWKLI